jgi:putative salt-induced outer membrane protein YdiY
MKRIFQFIAAATAVWIALAPPAVSAGELRLKNGDRFTGRPVKLEEGKLTFETEFAGQVQVDWAQVACIATDQPNTFRFSDDTTTSGTAECDDKGMVKITAPDEGGVVRRPLSDLTALNPPPAVRYKGNISAGASASSGNTDARSYYGNGLLEVRSETHRVTLAAQTNYAESDGTVTANSASGSGKYDYFLTEKLFAYGQTLLEQDQLQDLDLRTTVGAGLGYQFFDTTRLGLYAEAGPSYVNEDYGGAGDRSFTSGRWSLRLDWQIIPDRVKFFHFQEGYVSVEDAQDYFFRSKQGFQLPLINNFFCNIQMDYDYNNKPAPGKESVDLRYLLGLGYAFSN